ncbi:helix-turn-helix transcriptional regulator, partial [Nocardioides sp.]
MVHRLPVVGLLERESFLDAFEEYAEAAARGSGRLVLLSGDAGIGKSALVEAFRERRPELRWLWGACDASFTPRPLGPLFEVASQAGGEFRDLARAAADRTELFARSVAALDRPGETTVLVVEDLHGADDATLDWVSYLGRRLGRIHALVILTYRTSEPLADATLATTLGRLATHGSTRRMLLPPLSARAVAQLVAGRGLDPVHVLRVSGGNPFYVTEIAADPTAPVPPSVADVVRARVLRHSPAARRM